MSTRDTIRKARPKVHAVETPDGPVYVRALSGAGRQRYLDFVEAADGKVPYGRVAALALCEPDGTMVYDPEEPADVEECAEIDGQTLDSICMKLFEVSGLTKKAGDDAEKKLDASVNA